MPQPLIELQCTRSQIEALAILFQEGVILDIPGNYSIADLFFRHWGLSSEFAEKRIQTIFLNGHPVDQPEEIIPEHGSILALSAAMPGLVGATMRKSGPLAPLRDSITCRSTNSSSQPSQKRIYLKLFNFLLKELAPHFLKRGVLVVPSSLLQIIRQFPLPFWDHCLISHKSQNLPLADYRLEDLLSLPAPIKTSIKTDT